MCRLLFIGATHGLIEGIKTGRQDDRLLVLPLSSSHPLYNSSYSKYSKCRE